VRTLLGWEGGTVMDRVAPVVRARRLAKVLRREFVCDLLCS
jgi:hypothetical protein